LRPALAEIGLWRWLVAIVVYAMVFYLQGKLGYLHGKLGPPLT